MGSVSLAAICDAIAATLGTATGVTRTQSYSALQDDYNDLPLLRVYPQSGETDAWSDSDRSTFRGRVRVTEYLIHADVICRQRAHLDEDMKKAVEMQAAVETVLDAQQTKPYLGDENIKAFRWRWELMDFALGGESPLHYLGVRFYIYVRIF